MKFIEILIITLCSLMIACVPDQCGDLSNFPTEFDIIDLSMQVYKEAETGYPDTLYIENQEVDYSQLQFWIDAETQVIASNSKRSIKIPISFINSAYACSPAPPITNEKIVDINITSSSSFDESLAAGQSLNSKFDIVDASSSTRYRTLNNGEWEYYSLSMYLEQDEVNAGKKIKFKLNEAPQLDLTHTFFIEYVLDTGEIFSLETPEIMFTQL